MVLGLFRNNQLYTVFFLALIAVLLRLPAFAGWIHYQPVMHENTGFLFRVIFSKALDSALLSSTLAAFFVFIQALLVKWLANESRVNPDRNWFPALFTLVFMSAISSFQFLSPALVASVFIPLILKRLFSIAKSNEVALTIFDTGLTIGIATLFYLPSLWLAPIFLVGIFNLRTIKISELISFIVAVFTPWIISWGVILLLEKTPLGMNFGALLGWVHLGEESLDITFWASFCLFVLLLGILFLSVNVYYKKRLIQVQKFNNVLFWVVFGTVSTIFFNKAFDFSHLLLASSAFGIFLGLSFLSIQNKLVAEVLFFLFLIVIFIALIPEQLSQYQFI
jgi:hypothetical protein